MSKLITELDMVYVPMSIQETSWVEKIKEVESIGNEATIYFITQRKEVKFKDFDESTLTEDGAIRFKLQMGELISPIITFYIIQTIERERELNKFDFEAGEKMIRIVPSEDTSKDAFLFTSDIFLGQLLNNNLIFDVEDEYDFNFYRFVRYELLYIGQAAAEGAHTRLIKGSHDATTKVLRNASPLEYGAEIKNECKVFMFELTSYFTVEIEGVNLTINDYINDKNLKEIIINDCERALINQLRPKYNSVMYNNYPGGKGVLSERNITNCEYTINVPFIYFTDESELMGNLISNKKKILQVDGNKVKIN